MYRLKILLYISITLSFELFAQKGTQSPYSVFGLGELNNGEYAYFMSMGNALTANNDSTIVNQNNPASYANISRYRPLFQMGLNGRFSTFSNTNESSSARQFGLNQFQLGLPIKKNWGASFGLTPFSSTGYLIANSNIVDGDTISQKINEGAGTISQFHIGVAYKYKFKNASLSLGGNLRYLFGSSNKIQSFEYVAFPAGSVHSRIERTTRVKSPTYDFGFIFEKNFQHNSISLGFTYSPEIKLKANQDLLSYSYTESFYDNFSYFQYVIDTVEYIDNNSGIINLPASYKIGFEYRIRPKSGESQSYLIKISGDVKYQEWSNYYESFNNVITNNVFTNRLSNSFGIQYSPHTGRNANNNLIPWVGKLHYRFGFNYTLSQILISNTQLIDYGISFGLGIPVMTNNSNTNLNLGVKYGSFGTTKNNLIKEDYLGVFVGVTISPGVYDRWFLKRKYD
ncbi:MAG TPA: hypothetical protein EYG85_11190 [Crocinitomix sp.]|nr:hypothetical protein [Crocinitomix sp.]